MYDVTAVKDYGGKELYDLRITVVIILYDLRITVVKNLFTLSNLRIIGLITPLELVCNCLLGLITP